MAREKASLGSVYGTAPIERKSKSSPKRSRSHGRRGVKKSSKSKEGKNSKASKGDKDVKVGIGAKREKKVSKAEKNTSTNTRTAKVTMEPKPNEDEFNKECLQMRSDKHRESISMPLTFDISAADSDEDQLSGTERPTLKRRLLSRSASESASPATRRATAGLRLAQGFAAEPAVFPSAPSASSAADKYDNGSPTSAAVRGLLDKTATLMQDALWLKQAVEATRPLCETADTQDEGKEAVLRMPSRLHESLLQPENEAKLLKLTGLEACRLNEEGMVVIRAHSHKGLKKALGHLRRVAFHCQWGGSMEKVGALLNGKPERPPSMVVVRLAATSSRLQSHEAKLTAKMRKLRIGTQVGFCQVVVDGIPGVSRRHITLTFEPEKGACYVQDLSTNGTYLNGKRLPRPPYKGKKPQDARVRCFHGDELFFRLKDDEHEELGYVVNLVELT